jgi:DNA-binding NarL/FixJ family response regulator
MRVYCLSRHPLLGEGLKRLLPSPIELDIIGLEETADQALTHVRAHRPDIVILDIDGLTFEPSQIVLRMLHETPASRVISLDSRGNLMSICRSEQRSIHDVSDLLRAVTDCASEIAHQTPPGCAEQDDRP